MTWYSLIIHGKKMSEAVKGWFCHLAPPKDSLLGHLNVGYALRLWNGRTMHNFRFLLSRKYKTNLFPRVWETINRRQSLPVQISSTKYKTVF